MVMLVASFFVSTALVEIKVPHKTLPSLFPLHHFCAQPHRMPWRGFIVSSQLLPRSSVLAFRFLLRLLCVCFLFLLLFFPLALACWLLADRSPHLRSPSF